MANILGMDVQTAGLGGGGGGILNSTTLIIFGSILLILIGVAIVIWLYYMKKLYSKKIVVYENISGQGFQPVFYDTARVIKIGDGGEEIMWLKKKKVYRTAYGRKMGKDTYWFAVGQDGYWYNCVLGDLDAKMGMLDIEPIDRDMRYMHVAIRKNIATRYRKIKFMEKYGGMVFSAIFLLIMILGIWFLLDQMSENASIINEGVKIMKDVMELNRQVLSGLDNVCTGTKGLVPIST